MAGRGFESLRWLWPELWEVEGRLPEEMEAVVAKAQEALQSCSTKAALKVDKAIDALKQGFM